MRRYINLVRMKTDLKNRTSKLHELCIVLVITGRINEMSTHNRAIEKEKYKRIPKSNKAL